MEVLVEAGEGRGRRHTRFGGLVSMVKSRKVLRAGERGEGNFKRFLTSIRSSVVAYVGVEAADATRRRQAPRGGIQAAALG